MNTYVSDLLSRKGSKVVTIEPSASVYDAIARMVEHNVGSILVMDEGEIVGIFTERDYLRRIILQGRTSKTTRIEEVMTPNVIYVEPGYSVKECMAIMSERTCRHLPVMRDGEVVGVISIGDCVKMLSEDAQARVHYLTEYITGKYPV